MQDVLNSDYWKRRLAVAVDREKIHHAVWEGPDSAWDAIRDRHRYLLAKHVRSDERILDVGCGWGRLLYLLPDAWQRDPRANYLGIDLCKEFIAYARLAHPTRRFVHDDARSDFLHRTPPLPLIRYSLAVLVSVRNMLLTNAPEAWQDLEWRLRMYCDRCLCLEYDPGDKGLLLW